MEKTQKPPVLCYKLNIYIVIRKKVILLMTCTVIHLNIIALMKFSIQID